MRHRPLLVHLERSTPQSRGRETREKGEEEEGGGGGRRAIEEEVEEQQEGKNTKANLFSSSLSDSTDINTIGLCFASAFYTAALVR